MRVEGLCFKIWGMDLVMAKRVLAFLAVMSVGMGLGYNAVHGVPISEIDILNNLQKRFTDATEPKAGTEALLQGVEKNWTCSQYFLFKGAFFEVPEQPIRKFYGTLYTDKDVSKLKVTPDGDIIGEWGVAQGDGQRAKIFPVEMNELKKIAQNRYGIKLSDQPELSGVKSVTDPLQSVLFYIYCPKPR